MNGAELRALRKAAGYQANHLAEAMDISPATLSKYEHDKAEIPKKVELAARYLCNAPVSPQSTLERVREALKELLQ